MRPSIRISIAASLLMASPAIAGSPCVALETAMEKLAAKPNTEVLGIHPQPYTKTTSLLFWETNGHTFAGLVTPSSDGTGLCLIIDGVISLGDYSPEMNS